MKDTKRLNIVFLLGSLTSKPRLSKEASGKVICKFGFKVGGEKACHTGTSVCVELVTVGRVAESAAQFLHKGSPVFIEGRLRNDDEFGKSVFRVEVDRLQYLQQAAVNS